MRSDNERTKFIEQYLLGELQGEDLLEFEAVLQRDPLLREEVDLQDHLMKGIENHGIRKALNHIHFSQGYDAPYLFYLRKWKLFFAGIIILLFSPVAIFFMMPADIALEKTNLKDIKQSERTAMKADTIVRPDSSKAGAFYMIDSPGKNISETSGDAFTNADGARTGEASDFFAYENEILLSERLQHHIQESAEKDFIGHTPHYSHPHTDMVPKEKVPDLVYYKVFEDRPETRIIVLPAVVLDFDILYTHRTADPLMNEMVESLFLNRYENTFTSTTQFHWRIEGCQLYGAGAELLDIYLNNIHLKLWEADSIVIKYLHLKAYEDCENFTRYMEAAEYFRWLKSLKHGKPVRINALDNRHYRQGQLYNKLPDKATERFLTDNGLTLSESSELIGYFKKMYYYRKMFYRQKGSPERTGHLDYYYRSEGKYTGYKNNDCGPASILNKKGNYHHSQEEK